MTSMRQMCFGIALTWTMCCVGLYVLIQPQLFRHRQICLPIEAFLSKKSLSLYDRNKLALAMIDDKIIYERVHQFNQDFADASREIEKDWAAKPLLRFVAATISYPATFRSPEELARPTKFWPAVCEIILLMLAGIALPVILQRRANSRSRPVSDRTL